MSGGNFNYLQSKISDCAINVREHTQDYKDTCAQETLDNIKLCYETLEKAGKMLQRVDLFVSGDDGEESFNRRWKEDQIDNSDL